MTLYIDLRSAFPQYDVKGAILYVRIKSSARLTGAKQRANTDGPNSCDSPVNAILTSQSVGVFRK